MNRLSWICLKTVRWSSWPLLVLCLAFLATGYGISGRYGAGALIKEQEALTWHKLLHAPLVVLLLAHTAPAVYLALQRWGWIRGGPNPPPTPSADER
jgi:hypothetical protein